MAIQRWSKDAKNEMSWGLKYGNNVKYKVSAAENMQTRCIGLSCMPEGRW